MSGLLLQFTLVSPEIQRTLQQPLLHVHVVKRISSSVNAKTAQCKGFCSAFILPLEVKVHIINVLFIYVIGILCHSQEYFTYINRQAQNQDSGMHV